MTPIAATVLLFALLQDKPTVALVADSPTETAWPILGKVNRPDGAVLKVTALRVDRRWDPAADRFRELVSPEFRISRSTEVRGQAFRASLKAGTAGLYDITVYDGEQRIHAERMLLGRPPEFVAATRKSVAKLIELSERATASLGEIEKILAGKQPGTSKEREAFIKRIHGEEQLLQELATRTDLTGSVAFLTEICSQIRNAQVWELPPGKGDEELNDTQGEKRDIFLDPKLTFKGLHAMILSVKTILSRELALSAAATLDLAFARAEEKPDRALSRARDAAGDALKTLQMAPVEDRDARAVLETAERAEAPQIAEVRRSLKDLASKHLADP